MVVVVVQHPPLEAPNIIMDMILNTITTILEDWMNNMLDESIQNIHPCRGLESFGRHHGVMTRHLYEFRTGATESLSWA